jgi:hypothetical protein
VFVNLPYEHLTFKFSNAGSMAAMMVKIMFAEMADMHLIYGAADANGREAVHFYTEKFPMSWQPHPSTVATIGQQLCKVGSLRPINRVSKNCWNTRHRRTLLEEVADDLSTQMHAMTCTAPVSHSTVRCILHKQALSLPPAIYEKCKPKLPPQKASCQWFLKHSVREPNFTSSVLFTDDATFTQDGGANKCDMHLWAEENLHAAITHAHQVQLLLNVLCSMVHGYLIGPYVLPTCLMRQLYDDFHANTLLGLLEELLLDNRYMVPALWCTCTL